MNCLIAACSVLLFCYQADADRDELEDRLGSLFERGDAAIEQNEFTDSLRIYHVTAPTAAY